MSSYNIKGRIGGKEYTLDIAENLQEAESKLRKFAVAFSSTWQFWIEPIWGKL